MSSKTACLFLCSCLLLGGGLRSLGVDREAALRLLPPVSLPGGTLARVELAADPESRTRGLMERLHLEPDEGMCFALDAIGPVVFWMKNTRIPLDAVFLDPYGIVLSVQTMAVEPPRKAGESEDDYEKRLPHYRCDGPVASVLEVRAGGAEELGLAPGKCVPAFSLAALQRERENGHLENIAPDCGGEGHPAAETAPSPPRRKAPAASALSSEGQQDNGTHFQQHH